MSTAQRVIKNTGFLYAKMGITVFISLYTTRLVLDALGASDFGIFNVVGGAIAMLGFLHAAMSSATQRFMSFYEGKGDKEKQKYIFNVSTLLHYGIALMLVVILLIAGYFFFNGVLNIPVERVFAAKVIYGALVLSVAFTVISVPYEAVLNAHENMLYYSIVGVLESLLKLGVAIVIVKYAGDRLVLYGILMAIIPFVIRTIMQVYCHKKYEECVLAPKKYYDSNLLKEMTSFAGWSFLGTASSMISQYGLGIVLNNFFGTMLNAAQGVANQISGQAGALGPQIKKALSPVIVKSVGAQNNELAITSVILGTKLMLLVETIIFLPILLETDYLLDFWLKDVPEYASIFVILLLITNLIDTIFVFSPILIGATGKIARYQKVMSILSFLPILLCVIAFKLNAPPYSLYLVTIFASLIKLLFNSMVVNKLFESSKRSFYLSIFVGYTFSILIAYVCTYWSLKTMEEGFIKLIFTAILADGVFILLYFFLAFNKTQRLHFINKSAVLVRRAIYKNGK